MPLSPLKNPPASVVTSERPFIQPTRLVRRTSSSQPATCTSEMPVVQSTELINQFTASQGQPITVTSEMPVQQSTGPVSQRTSSQTSTSKKVLPTASVSGAAVQQDPDSDLEQQPYRTSHISHMEEEGEVSDQVTVKLEREPDKQLSEEQNRQFITGLANQRNLMVLLPELLDSPYLLDHWLPGLLHRKH